MNSRSITFCPPATCLCGMRRVVAIPQSPNISPSRTAQPRLQHSAAMVCTVSGLCMCRTNVIKHPGALHFFREGGRFSDWKRKSTSCSRSRSACSGHTQKCKYIKKKRKFERRRASQPDKARELALFLRAGSRID